jgi:hypothetical protein
MSTFIRITVPPKDTAPPEVDGETRALIHDIADALMPDTNSLPSVADADTAGSYLDAALIARPDLVTPFFDAVALVSRDGVDSGLQALRSENGQSWEVLTTILPAAYLMNPAVRQALGYAGQTPQPIQTPAPAEESTLYEPVIARGPIYRPTPAEPDNRP